MHLTVFQLGCCSAAGRHQRRSGFSRSAILVLASSLLGPICSAQEPFALLASYQDAQSGRKILVSGGTPQATALQWLTDVKQANDETALERIHAARLPQGLKPSTADFVVARDTAVSQYKDTRTGRTVWVLGGTSQTTAAEWMHDVNRAEAVPDMAALIIANHSRGLLAGTMTIGGVSVQVAWGHLVSKNTASRSEEPQLMPPDTVMTKLFEVLGRAKSEMDLVEFLRANRSQGISSVGPIRIPEGQLQMMVSVVWVRR